MTLSLYFLRHGQTAHSRDNLFCGCGSNPSITDRGREMAAQFGEAYKHLAWSGIYSSPLTRAQETVEPLRSALGAGVELREGLKEIDYGAWEGKSVEEVKLSYHDDHLRWSADPAFNAPTGGETAIRIAQRAMAVVEEITDGNSNGNFLLVSHKATIRIVLCSLMGIDVGRFRERIGCPVSSVSRVEFAARGPLIHFLADRSHLSLELRELAGT